MTNLAPSRAEFLTNLAVACNEFHEQSARANGTPAGYFAAGSSLAALLTHAEEVRDTTCNGGYSIGQSLDARSDGTFHVEFSLSPLGKCSLSGRLPTGATHCCMPPSTSPSGLAASPASAARRLFQLLAGPSTTCTGRPSPVALRVQPGLYVCETHMQALHEEMQRLLLTRIRPMPDTMMVGYAAFLHTVLRLHLTARLAALLQARDDDPDTVSSHIDEAHAIKSMMLFCGLYHTLMEGHARWALIADMFLHAFVAGLGLRGTAGRIMAAVQALCGRFNVRLRVEHLGLPHELVRAPQPLARPRHASSSGLQPRLILALVGAVSFLMAVYVHARADVSLPVVGARPHGAAEGISVGAATGSSAIAPYLQDATWQQNRAAAQGVHASAQHPRRAEEVVVRREDAPTASRSSRILQMAAGAFATLALPLVLNLLQRFVFRAGAERATMTLTFEPAPTGGSSEV